MTDLVRFLGAVAAWVCATWVPILGAIAIATAIGHRRDERLRDSIHDDEDPR